MSGSRLRIGLSARILHEPPPELGFRGKTLQYLEQSVAHWLVVAAIALRFGIHMVKAIGGADMPVLEVWKAKTSTVVKRSIAFGHAGADNPLFYRENNRMLFGDAKKMLDEVLAVLQT